MKNTYLVPFAAALFVVPSFFTGPTGFSARHEQGALTFQSSAGATAPNSPASAGTSLNWSGYTATGGIFTSVNGNWIVPESAAAPSDNGSLSADATWVGIGGISRQDLIQAGTQSIFQNGTETYEAWYETLPNDSQEVPLTVHPGDAVSVSVTEQAGGDDWNISFTDSTTGQRYETSVVYQSSLSSAEWIEEMPSDQNGFVALDNFGTVSFTNGTATENGNEVTISGANAQLLTMVNRANQALATVSPLDVDGAGFTVTRTSAAASTPSIYVRRGNGRWSRVGIGVQGYTAPTRSYRTTPTTPTGTTTITTTAPAATGTGYGSQGQGYRYGYGGNGRFYIGFNGFPAFFRVFVNNFRDGGER